MMTVLSKIQKKNQKLKNNISNKEVSSNNDGVEKESEKGNKSFKNNIPNKVVSGNV